MDNVKETKVFLGGTVCGVDPLYGWRGVLIPKLRIPYFNPVVKSYNKESRVEEYYQKSEVCNLGLFVITPDIRGYFSIAEAVDFSNKNPRGTIFCVLNETYENDKKFSWKQLKSFDNVGELIERNGGYYFKSLDKVIDFLNLHEGRQPMDIVNSKNTTPLTVDYYELQEEISKSILENNEDMFVGIGLLKGYINACRPEKWEEMNKITSDAMAHNVIKQLKATFGKDLIITENDEELTFE